MPDAIELFGSGSSPAGLAQWTPLTSGTRGGRTGGLPISAAQDRDASAVICGMRDDAGDHGVAVFVWFTRVSGTVVMSLSVMPWRQ